MNNTKIDKLIDDCFNHYLCSGKLQINDLREEIREKLKEVILEEITDYEDLSNAILSYLEYNIEDTDIFLNIKHKLELHLKFKKRRFGDFKEK